MSAADDAYRFCGQFEAELLLELMLRYWRHPLADDGEFRDSLLETATNVLRAAAEGESLMESLDAPDMNFVAAVWYSEWTALESSGQDISQAERDARNRWLAEIRQSLPSCFCRQDDLLE